MNAWFYILYSPSSDQYYVGHTTEPIQERLRKHSSNHDGFTGKYRGWAVVYTEQNPTNEAAYARERQVKGWKGRRMIEKLIANNNPGRTTA